jgi:ferrochelatase
METGASMTTRTRTGILLCNLGTPSAPTTGALRSYLREFLSDPRVVELPRLQWLPVLHGFVLPFRARRAATLYRKIWSDGGSPLRVLSERLRSAFATALQAHRPHIEVELAMRYGSPSVASGLQRLRGSGCTRILVFPLFPQYSATTTASAFDGVWNELRRWRVVPAVRTISGYADEEAYVAALHASVRERWNQEGAPDKLLLSFHGIPKRYYDAGDPYPDQCRRTAELLIPRLGIEPHRCEMSFQSVFGREEWVGPATDATVKRLAKEGVRSLDVLCPGFAVDCLETLEEIDGLNRDHFLSAGGTRFRYIGCLNDRRDHARMLAGVARRNLEGWESFDPAPQPLLRRS